MCAGETQQNSLFQDNFAELSKGLAGWFQQKGKKFFNLAEIIFLTIC